MPMEYALHPKMNGDLPAESTVEKDLSVLRKHLNAGFEAGLTPHSCPEFKVEKAAAIRAFCFTREEARLIIENADCYHGKIFSVIAFASGQRMSAILQLVWDRIDFDKRMIYFEIPGVKSTNKKRGQVPISDELYDRLLEAKNYTEKNYPDCENVVHYNGEPVTDIYNAFKRARCAAGISKGSPHSCKHSMISWLAMDGYSVDDISDFTSTSPKIVLKHYRHINPMGLKPMAEALSFKNTRAANDHFQLPEDAVVIEDRKGKKIMIASAVSIETVEIAIADGLVGGSDIPDLFLTPDSAVRKLS
jgi:hypothetical protein